MAHRPGRKRRSRDATVSALDARSRNRVRDGRRRGSDHRLHGPARVASTDCPCRGGRARHRTDVRSAQPAVRLRQDRAVDQRQGSGGERRRGTRGGGVAGRRADHATGASARSRILGARGRARLLRSHVAPLLGRRAAADRCCRRRGRDRRLVARLVGSFDLQGCVEGRGRALPHHAQGPDPRAHWRARGRRHHVAPRVPRRRAKLGLPVLLDPGRGARARLDDGCWIRGGGDQMARLGDPRRRRRPRRPADHVRDRRRAPARRVRARLAAGLRGVRPGAGRERCLGSAAA